jgi:hypothetical protein
MITEVIYGSNPQTLANLSVLSVLAVTVHGSWFMFHAFVLRSANEKEAREAGPSFLLVLRTSYRSRSSVRDPVRLIVATAIPSSRVAKARVESTIKSCLIVSPVCGNT